MCSDVCVPCARAARQQMRAAAVCRERAQVQCCRFQGRVEIM